MNFHNYCNLKIRRIKDQINLSWNNSILVLAIVSKILMIQGVQGLKLLIMILIFQENWFVVRLEDKVYRFADQEKKNLDLNEASSNHLLEES